MRFDDTLDTVLAGDLDTPFAAQSAWRQIVDLMGRGRIIADERTVATLTELRGRVPAPARAASARALAGACPPAALVRLFATDDMAIAGPVLRGSTLPVPEWIALLPQLTPAGRAVLRHRRDLPAEVTRALESFGAVDFVLPPADMAPRESEVPTPTVSVAADSGSDVFRIADVVARIEAYRRDKEAGIAPTAPPAVGPVAAPAAFRFETDPMGAIRWVDGVTREPVIGMSLARVAPVGAAGVDGVAAGAFRRRGRFDNARLVIAGTSDAGGEWRLAGVPAFDLRSGRFTGYRGTARRARTEEQPGRTAPAHPAIEPDSMRQLVHELRTPTNAIAGFSEMIEHAMLGPVPDTYRQQATAIRRDAGGLLAAIDDLDMAARIQSGALSLRSEPVSLISMIDRVAGDLGPLAAERGARLKVTGDAPEALGDDRAVHRLIERLIATMLGAAGAGEAIVVTLDTGDSDIILSVDRPQSLAGMSRSALLAADEDSPATLLGTGFALRLASNLARELGGTLAIEARCLTLHLPAAVGGTVEQARQN